MTARAIQPFVTPQQRESRYGHVIERELCPGRGAMAVDALCAVASFVNVVLAVALVAGMADFGGVLAEMTILTANCCVRARQRKARLAMLERRVCPCFRTVARAAVFPERARVYVMRTMARHAI